MTVTIYHNPRCSKSRETLSLLEENGHQPTVVEYLKDPLDAAQLKTLISQLGFSSAHDLLRSKEEEYTALGLSKTSSEDEIIAAMVQCPKLMERPVVVVHDKAAVGRPPESVLALFA
jgi:arsenate reductase